MSDLRIQIGHRYEPMSDGRRAATEDLADELRDDGLAVEVEIIGYKPGRRALSPVEWTAIFIGTNVATSLLGSLTTDVYDRTKRMLAKRKLSHEPGRTPARPLGFVIYGPRGEELRRWTTADDDGPKANGDNTADST